MKKPTSTASLHGPTPEGEASALAEHARICPGARADPRPYRDGRREQERWLEVVNITD